ncbi:MAG: flagellar FliJ protein [Planctomycetota bacterium]|jgi:flagellar FliJ protein
MTRTQRLQPVVRHADKKQQQALQAVAKSQAVYEAELGRLQQLNNYRQEYQQNSANLCSAYELQELQRFLSQLDDTIVKQQELIGIREKELEQIRQAWKLTRIDAKMMNKVVENIEKQEVIELERQEQKVLDEFCQRIPRG